MNGATTGAGTGSGAGEGEERRVFAVRYGTRTGTRAEIYLNHSIHGEPDGPLDMDYYVWLVTGPGGPVVVDTGYSPRGGARRGRTTLTDPVAELRRAGAGPEHAPLVVVTHAHYDHIGNLGAFDRSEVVMARAEFDFWTGPLAVRAQFAHSVEAEDIDALRRVRDEGRLTLVDGPVPIAPGIRVLPVGGHTPGQLVVLVEVPGGEVVLASDALHYYEELELDRPFAFVADLPAMYRGFDLLQELVERPGRVLVPGHDPEVVRRFPAEPGTGGLVRRVA
ncbi:N-acyl homoserine lactonase family protein [Streptomyces tagetis]|uniref:N-acyl homoserine lactonase family protein n=1 Tax=Streptomyces tagetis TaxID=2820809 RepID=A0A941B6M7_9ACTN|nr:N-acyl homoserine lactonase family protein [Streptomyces sp. RG38]MBQ0826543.1 N-acyl homoserine lactonase family protein [Streptomyces sp. RG38]